MARKKTSRYPVICIDCGSPARIESSNKLDIKVTEKYCACTNVEHCGATFVLTVSFSRHLNPPMKTTRQIAMELLRSIPEEERLQLQRDLFS